MLMMSGSPEHSEDVSNLGMTVSSRKALSSAAATPCTRHDIAESEGVLIVRGDVFYSSAAMFSTRP